MIRRAPYNRELIIFDRWRVPYAPAYGWRWWFRNIWQIATRTHPYYRRKSDDA